MLKTPFFWHSKSFASRITSYFFLPIAAIYYLAYLANACFKHFFIKKTKLPIKAILVGNYTMGGAGKTPFCIALANFYLSRGKRVCFLSKGYGRKLCGFYEVNSAKNLNLDPFLYGDEPVLLSKTAPVFLYSKASDLKKPPYQNFDIAIMDDGLHGGLIKPSQTIILWDGALNYTNKLPFPAGGFRCLLSNPFIKADIHFAILPQGMQKPLNQSFFAKIPSFYTAKTSVAFKNDTSLQSLQNSKVIAFCGIARPQKFYQSLELLGIKPVKTISFADHHSYTKQEVLRLLNYKKDGFALITTAKDIVKIEHLIGNQHGFNVLQISTLFDFGLFYDKTF